MMIRYAFLLLPGLILCCQSQQNVCSEESESTGNDFCLPRQLCRLVVAPSTIPDAGLGIFTTVQLKPNELIGYGDMVIPLPRIPSSLPNPFEDYSWNGRVYRGGWDAFAPGLQSLTNSHLALLNVQQVKPASNVFPDAVDSTPYHYLQTITEHEIPEGGELFTFYGDHWFQSRDRFKSLPLAESFSQAENLTRAFLSIGSDHLALSRPSWPGAEKEILSPFGPSVEHLDNLVEL